VLSIVTPDGAPVNEYTIGAEPVDVTLKYPTVPLSTLVLAALVIIGL